MLGGMLIAQALLLLGFTLEFLEMLAMGQRVEGLGPVTLVRPMFLPGSRCVFGVVNDALLLGDGLIQLQQEGRVIAPGIGVDPPLGGGEETGPVFLTILAEHLQLVFASPFTGNEFAQLASGIIHASLGQILKRLQWGFVWHCLITLDLVRLKDAGTKQLLQLI